MIIFALQSVIFMCTGLRMYMYVTGDSPVTGLNANVIDLICEA